MTEQQRPHWARFFAFLGIVISVLLLINVIPKQERTIKNPYWRYFYEELPENSLDIVFMGNSHAQCAFIPEIIDAILGTNSVNLITPSEAIYQTKYEYLEVLRYQDPAAVVIETTVIYGGVNQPDQKPLQFSFMDSMPFSLRKVGYLLDLYSFKDLIRYMFPFLAQHTDWKTPNILINKIINFPDKNSQPVELKDQGYYQLTDILPLEWEQKNEFKEPETCPAADLSDRLEAANDVLKADASDPSRLLFIEAPAYRNRYQLCQKPTFELIDGQGVPHYELLDDVDLPNLWFHDPTHMSQFGAVIASIDTARLLSKELDIEMNPEALDYFMGYRFRDYVQTREGRTVHIELIPFDLEASKNLTYQWEVYSDGVRVSEKEDQTGSEYSFTMPNEQEEYLIMVKINNPDGDYVLVGEFSVNKDRPTEIIRGINTPGMQISMGWVSRVYQMRIIFKR